MNANEDALILLARLTDAGLGFIIGYCKGSSNPSVRAKAEAIGAIITSTLKEITDDREGLPV